MGAPFESLKEREWEDRVEAICFFEEKKAKERPDVLGWGSKIGKKRKRSKIPLEGVLVRGDLKKKTNNFKFLLWARKLIGRWDIEPPTIKSPRFAFPMNERMDGNE